MPNFENIKEMIREFLLDLFEKEPMYKDFVILKDRIKGREDSVLRRKAVKSISFIQ